MKQKFYDITDLLEKKAQYNIIMSKRNVGKSFQVVKTCVEDFFNTGARTNYLRRFGVDVKPSLVEDYFDDENYDMRKWTQGKFDGICAWRGHMYFYNFDDKTGEKKRSAVDFGRYGSLASHAHTKSTHFRDCGNIVFEEFIPTNGVYLDNEPNELQQYVSTVARSKDIRVFMLGNMLDRACPYFEEWGLVGVPKQKPGTIEEYQHINDMVDGEESATRICVEYAEATGKSSKMFWKRNSITENIWESREQSKLPKKYRDYKVLYMLTFNKGMVRYLIELLEDEEDNVQLLYVHEIEEIPIKCRRIIRPGLSVDPLITSDFSQVTYGDTVVKELIRRNLVCYSSNLVGTEVADIIKKF